MKKWIIIGIAAIALVAVAGFAWAGKAYAQSQNPPWQGGPFGMMGAGGGYGFMHSYMVAPLANALKLTPEEVQSRLNQGETPWQIAQSQGIDQAQFQKIMADVQDQALDAAVKAGVLTQAQADWMDQHMESMWSGDWSGVACPGMGGWYNGSSNNSSSGAPSSGTGFGPMMRRGNRASY